MFSCAYGHWSDRMKGKLESFWYKLGELFVEWGDNETLSVIGEIDRFLL